MSEDLSCESEPWRADTAAWHPLPTCFTLTFTERAMAGLWARGAVSGIIFMLWLLPNCFWHKFECPNHPAPFSTCLVWTQRLVWETSTHREMADPPFGLWKYYLSEFHHSLHMWLLNYLESVCWPDLPHNLLRIRPWQAIQMWWFPLLIMVFALICM